jgi:hypothetical protein
VKVTEGDTMEKRIFFHRRKDDIDGETFAKTYRAAHETLVADTGVQCAIDLALDDQSPMDRAGMKARPLTWHAVSLRWGDVASSSQASQQLAAVVAAASGWRVQEHVAWDYDRDWPDGEPTPGVKFVSFVAKRPELSPEEFQERYRNHVEVAREHHIGCWKYVQNVVLGPVTLPPGKIIHGVSELWFRSLDDYVERLYARRPESVDAVREDTSGFIDFANTSSMLVQETWLRSSPVL